MKFRRKKRSAPPPLPPPPPPPPIEAATTTSTASAKKKAAGSRLWMRMDRLGQLIECDKSVIVKRFSVPARDFKILGPIFSDSASIHARKNAVIVNLEFIRAIVTKEELLLLNPLQQEFLPFVDQLRQHLLQKNSSQDNTMPPAIDELPFEFEVLEIALEAVSTYLDSSVAELERDVYPALDEMVIRVSTKNLDRVRSLKCNLTRLLGRVQKVRDAIEHLLDDNEDTARLHLTQKWIQKQENDPSGATSNSIVPKGSNQDVEDLEMLLESYFLQLDSTRYKILSVREYIDGTEDNSYFRICSIQEASLIFNYGKIVYRIFQNNWNRRVMLMNLCSTSFCLKEKGSFEAIMNASVICMILSLLDQAISVSNFTLEIAQY